MCMQNNTKETSRPEHDDDQLLDDVHLVNTDLSSINLVFEVLINPSIVLDKHTSQQSFVVQKNQFLHKQSRKLYSVNNIEFVVW